MGLHAGWVFVRNAWADLVTLKSFGSATQFWGSERIVDGCAAAIILAVIAIGLYVELIKHQNRQQAAMGTLP